jgi:hypothetical protein
VFGSQFEKEEETEEPQEDGEIGSVKSESIIASPPMKVLYVEFSVFLDIVCLDKASSIIVISVPWSGNKSNID